MRLAERAPPRRRQHLHLLCPQLSPSSSSSSSTPHGHPGGGPGGQPGTTRASERASRRAAAARNGGRRRAASPGAAPLRSGSAPGPARRRERGRQLAAAGRPLARTPPRPPPAMSAAAGCRQSRCRPAAAGSTPPPLFFVRCERRRCSGARAEAPSLPRPLLRGEGPERGCPAPPRPPSVPPALSGSCLLLLLLLPVVQAPPSLLSFAARISLEFYSLPHVTHRVKLHLRRVTHQHSASPSRPGHRQQQPPPTEEPQPGSQPAPPSAECAAATHGNSRARPGAAREAPPPRYLRNLPKAFGFFRALRRGWLGKAGEGGLRPVLEERSYPRYGGWRLRTPAEEIWRKRGLCVARWGDSPGWRGLAGNPRAV